MLSFEFMSHLMRVIIVAVLLLLPFEAARAQWSTQSTGATVRLRGVSAASASVAWASGDKGTYARTTDGGRTWTNGTVPGASDLDFRDADAFDSETAYLLSIGEGEKSRIYKTTDGGRRWALQFKNERPDAFFDAMAFWDRDHGVALSDPVGGRFLIIRTSDGGATWKETPPGGMPEALKGEGAFAASGTCIAVRGTRQAWFGSGGPEGARVFRSNDGGRTWQVSRVPLASGKTAGVFSIAFRDSLNGIAVGGDYAQESESKDNVALTRDGGRTWLPLKGSRPGGYRSCVAYVRGRRSAQALVAVGPSGTDYSTDGGRNWRTLSDEGFHSVSFKGTAGWAVGEQGRVAKFEGAAIKAARTRSRG
jgi:photosystem II stability/assembly factor-like uncharacterized protein